MRFSTCFPFYFSYGHFEDVRLASIDCLVDLTKSEFLNLVIGYLTSFTRCLVSVVTLLSSVICISAESLERGLHYLIGLIEKDPVPFIR